MNWTLLNVVSDMYTVAMFRNIKQESVVKHHDSRLTRLVKLFHRG